MSARNDGGPAFPVVDHMGDGDEGLSLRDYFAAKAMAATIMVTSSGDHAAGSVAGIDGGADVSVEVRIASDAYAMADAMLAAREAKP